MLFYRYINTQCIVNLLFESCILKTSKLVLVLVGDSNIFVQHSSRITLEWDEITNVVVPY